MFGGDLTDVQSLLRLLKLVRTASEGPEFALMLKRPAANAVLLSVLLLCPATVTRIGAFGDVSQTPSVLRSPEVLRLPQGWQLNRGPMGAMRTELALAPDGTSVVFSASPDGTMPKARLYRQMLNGGEASIVRGTPEGVCMPIFSPDGQWIAFWVAQKLYKVPVNGGPSIPLADIPDRPFGMSWAPDGRIVLGAGRAGLSFVPGPGGTPRTLTTVDNRRDKTHRLPHVLPGGKGVVFTAMAAPSGLETRVEWLSLETGRRKLLVDDASDGQYAPTGHLLFVRRGVLMAVPFDSAAARTTGPAVTVVPHVMHAFNTLMPDMNSGAGQYSLSETGALVWASGGTLPDYASHLYWIERSGRAEPWTAFGARPVSGLRLSPDGRRLAFNTAGLDRGVFVYDIERNSTTRLTSDGRTWYGMPFWTADGTRIGFGWSETGLLRTWWMPAVGKGKIERLGMGDLDQRAGGWTRDGRYLAFVEGSGPPRSGVDVKVLRMVDRQVVPFAASKADEAYPDFSPDGRWLAYVSNETGRNEVYVRSFPDGRRTVQITTAGGTAPAWAPGGRELFYFDLAFKKLMKVDVAVGGTLSASAPHPLFEFSAAGSSALRTYDITPDGRRFLIRKAPDTSPVPVTELHLERRWLDMVRRSGTD